MRARNLGVTTQPTAAMVNSVQVHERLLIPMRIAIFHDLLIAIQELVVQSLKFLVATIVFLIIIVNLVAIGLVLRANEHTYVFAAHILLQF